MKDKLTDKQKAFLDALFGDEAKGDIKMALKIAGYTKNNNHLVYELKDEVLDRARNYLALHAPRAAMGLTGVLDNPTNLGNKSTLAAATQILDRIGIIKQEKVEITGISGGLFILPEKDGDDGEAAT